MDVLLAGGPDFSLLLMLAGAAFMAGFVDSIAGGGGLITVPALMLAGFDPATAIATNKVQGASGAMSATLTFGRAGLIDWRHAAPMAAIAALGGVGGAVTVHLLPIQVLAAAVPLLLIAMGLYFGLSGRLREEDAHRRLAPAAFALTIAPIVGFYDGVFGPGAGSFYMLGFVTLLGLGVRRATGHTKFLNLASNLGSLAFFMASGAVVWRVGLVMAACSMLGAQIGSRTAIRHGGRVIRPLLVIVCCAAALKLLSDPANPLRMWTMAAIGR